MSQETTTPAGTGTQEKTAGGAHRLTRESVLNDPPSEVFAWHERAGAVERLVPPWEPVHVEQHTPGLDVGKRVVFRTTAVGPMVVRWVSEHTACDPPHGFRDAQVSGPFASWEHNHRFEPETGERTRLIDEVDYELPLRPVGNAAAWPLVQSRLRRMFDFRHRQLADDLAAHRRARARGVGTLHVAVTGATGLIGSALVAFLRSGGHRVTRLVRGEPSAPGDVAWGPNEGGLDPDALRGVDAVIHLAGAPLFGRWTEQGKHRIKQSRVRGTRLLAETMARTEDGPSVLVCGSAIGYYGYERGDAELTEDAETGDGFLAEVARDWEGAADPARDAGVRVVHVRTGLVQTPRGGTLHLQLPFFQAGLGGRLGSGRQWMSWIGIDDIVGLFHHALTTEELSGPINGTAPQPVRNADYTRVLGHVLRRPTLVPVPKAGPSLLLGAQGATETALASQRVVPARAEATGYEFRHRSLDAALRHVLGR